ncbi:GrpB family protein [Paenibacillus nasutitermitis]|uniref:GrpB family protein n=1 Tax=Paenibacillus nasutitermitis TaxID=1652958 RepID=A0A917DWU4_9BACL|nr:GrpB family protein [Paenibacillus nasutitermitis]GGD77962.1 hypothetical protein GCM10010911_39950 [Paenibacillus nasutitermitis]
MSDEILIHEYQDEWPLLFHEVGLKLRKSLGEAASRIDHIGSTSVPGLHAKPIIDIQISVRRLERMEEYKAGIERAGFLHRPENPDLTKRYFRELPGHRRTHIHVREEGSWSQQFALLFRDYLRCHPDDCKIYADDKYELARTFRHQREAYVNAKEPMIWTIMNKATRWSQQTGWRPGVSDH